MSKIYYKVIGMGQLYKIGNWHVAAESKEQVQGLARNRGFEVGLDEIEMVSGSIDHIIGESDDYESVMNMNNKVAKL